VNFDGNKFTIEVETSAHRNMFDEDDKSLIANYLSDMTGRRLKIEVTVSNTNTLAKLNNHKPQEMTWLRLRSEAEQDEEVQLAMKFFGGEIIDVKP